LTRVLPRKNLHTKDVRTSCITLSFPFLGKRAAAANRTLIPLPETRVNVIIFLISRQNEDATKKTTRPARCVQAPALIYKIGLINFSVKILSEIGQKPYFDTRLRLKIAQICSACNLVKQVNNRFTCANRK
jgi:hypothetical protein